MGARITQRNIISKYATNNWGPRESMCSEGRKAYDFVVACEKKGLTATEIVATAAKKHKEFFRHLDGAEDVHHEFELDQSEAIAQLETVNENFNLELSEEFQATVKKEVARIKALKAPLPSFRVAANGIIIVEWK